MAVPPPSSLDSHPPVDKPALRRTARAARRAYSAAGPEPIAVPTPFRARLRPGLTVATYLPLAEEADPAPLVEAALAAGCTLALPYVVSREAPIRFVPWQPGTPLIDGPFGLRQPAAPAHDLTPDIVLVPIVAFDEACNRLGQGAGHYDRALAALPHAWRIGIAWEVQRVPFLPVDRWDVPLHGIATERGFLERHP